MKKFIITTLCLLAIVNLGGCIVRFDFEPYYDNYEKYETGEGYRIVKSSNITFSSGVTEDTQKVETTTIAEPILFYDDEYVTIEFVGCSNAGDSWYDKYMIFNLTNKTNSELTFAIGAIAFDNVSYDMSGSKHIAPKSIGQASFGTNEDIPINGFSQISGSMAIWDLENNTFENDWSHEVQWINVSID